MIIGLCGYTGVGKDEVAKHLVSKHGFARVAFADAMRNDLYKLNPAIVNGELLNIAYRQILAKGFLSPQDYHEMKLAGLDLQQFLSVGGVFADKLEKLEISSYEVIESASNGYLDVRRLVEAVDRFGWDTAKRVYPELRRLLQVYGTEVGREGFGEDVWVERAIDEIRKHKKVVVTDVRFMNEVHWLTALDAHFVQVVRPGHGPINNHASEQLDYAEIAQIRLSNCGDIAELQTSVDTLLESLGSPNA